MHDLERSQHAQRPTAFPGREVSALHAGLERKCIDETALSIVAM